MRNNLADQDSDAVLAQFNQLIEDILAGTLRRTTFRTWEIEILVDMVGCDLPHSPSRDNTLREYRNAMQRHIRQGACVPLKLSDYLQSAAGGRRTFGAPGG